MRRIIVVLICLMAFPVYAETAYVTERLPVALRAAFAEGSPVVKVIEGGVTLDVLERTDKFARVRDGQGAEGWIETRFLTNAPPARPQFERVQAELGKARKDLTDAQARIHQLESTLTQESTRSAELSKTIERAKAQAAAQAAVPTVPEPPSANASDFFWGWLVLAFAMLWIGFGAGVVWLRERHRKRLGGMYLRI